MWHHYQVSIQVIDATPGWKLGARVLPRRYVTTVSKFVRVDATTGRMVAELGPREIAAIRRDGSTESLINADSLIGLSDWLIAEIESSPTQPPRCTALRAPAGISTPEQRFPLASLVTDVSATVASRNGTFFDGPIGLEYEDTQFEVNRARGRRRGRSSVTPERLEDVARIARQHPRTPTAAVQDHFRISRGYARRLIKAAEEAGLETVGRD